MKLAYSHIALSVLLALTLTFAWQTYSLTGLYRSQRDATEQRILDAMRITDYNEMWLRIEQLRTSYKGDRKHGQIAVSTGISNDEHVIQSQTIVETSSKDSTTYRIKVVKQKEEQLQKPVQFQDTPNVSLPENQNINRLATFFQRGLHSGLDVLSDPDIVRYDSLLQAQLRTDGLPTTYRLDILHAREAADSTRHFTDTIATRISPGYVQGPHTRTYTYSYDFHGNYSWSLQLEISAGLLLRQMAGVIAANLVILLILILAFAYLIRIILHQKSMEEMTGDFTHNITHELKTPIAVAYAANDALLNFGQDSDPVQRRKYLNICREELQRLGGLVEQILSMSMERQKNFRLRPEEIRLADMVHQLTEQHCLKVGKPVSITTEIRPESLTLTADRTHLYHILSNLLDNAIKYSPDAAVITLTATSNPTLEHPQRVEIQVTDQGIGIPADKQRHIFDKFYRVPTGNLHDVKGYGLGLYYVKSLVTCHGGTITVESTPGRGSTFIIQIG